MKKPSLSQHLKSTLNRLENSLTDWNTIVCETKTVKETRDQALRQDVKELLSRLKSQLDQLSEPSSQGIREKKSDTVVNS